MAILTWSPRAIKDINEIATYIAKDSLQYAQAQTRLFFSTALILEKYPHKGRPVPELGMTNIRQLLCGHFRIIYEVFSDEEVAILTVHHQSRIAGNNPVLKKRLRRRG